jgi:hypothetical protein
LKTFYGGREFSGKCFSRERASQAVPAPPPATKFKTMETHKNQRIIRGRKRVLQTRETNPVCGYEEEWGDFNDLIELAGLEYEHDGNFLKFAGSSVSIAKYGFADYEITILHAEKPDTFVIFPVPPAIGLILEAHYNSGYRAATDSIRTEAAKFFDVLGLKT